MQIHPNRTRGLTLLEVFLLLGVLALIVFLAIPNYARTRQEMSRNACLAQLQQIARAKEQWAREQNRPAGSPIDAEAVARGLKQGRLPVCPAGGTYTLNPVGTPPTCSLAESKGHRP